MNNHANFILGSPKKVVKKRIRSTILSEKEKNPFKAIKLTDKDPKEETFDSATTNQSDSEDPDFIPGTVFFNILETKKHLMRKLESEKVSRRFLCIEFVCRTHILFQKVCNSFQFYLNYQSSAQLYFLPV